MLFNILKANTVLSSGAYFGGLIKSTGIVWDDTTRGTTKDNGYVNWAVAALSATNTLSTGTTGSNMLMSFTNGAWTIISTATPTTANLGYICQYVPS